MLGIRAVVVLHKHNAHLVRHVGVGIDQPREFVDILDDSLRADITRRGFCAEDIRRRRKLLDSTVFEAKVCVEYAKRVEQLTFVLVHALDLHVKDEVRRQIDAFLFLNELAELLFLETLDLVELLDITVGHMILQRCDLFQIGKIAFTDARIEIVAQFRVAKTEPATLCDAVGLVLELTRKRVVPLFEYVVFENLGMQRRNAVDVTRAIHRKVRHVDELALNDRHARAIKLARHQFAAEFRVDLIDDIKHFRQHRLKQVDVPFFKRFRHDGVVRIGKRLCRDIKRAIKRNPLFHEQADQFRNTHGRVRVVELNRNMLGKAVDRAILALEAEDDILQARAGEEILLLEAQFFARFRRVVGIQHAGDVLHRVLFQHGKGIFLIVKELEIKLRNGFALPKAQSSDVVGLIAENRHIIRHRANGHIRKANGHLVRIAADAPRIAKALPVVRAFNLKSVAEGLFEQAVFITDAVAIQREIFRCGGVEEASRKPA